MNYPNDYWIPIVILALSLWTGSLQKGLNKKVVPLTWGVLMILLPSTWDMVFIGIVFLMISIVMVNAVEAAK